MPRHYPAELRRRTCERMLAGESVKDLSVELGIRDVTLYRWRIPSVWWSFRRSVGRSW